MRRTISILLSAMMLSVLLFSGCTAGGKTPLRFIDVTPRPDRETFYKEMITAFQKENPNVEVIYESVPWDDAANKLTVMATAKELPDIVNLYPGWMPQYVSAGWVLPLDKYLDASGIKDKFSAYARGMYWRRKHSSSRTFTPSRTG